MKKKITIVFGFTIFCLSSFGQSPSFSQFFQKNPYVNPAYTGIMGVEEIHTICRRCVLALASYIQV